LGTDLFCRAVRAVAKPEAAELGQGLLILLDLVAG